MIIIHFPDHAQVQREISTHSSLSHPHVVDFYAAFEDASYIYLVLEYAEGVSFLSLSDMIAIVTSSWRSGGPDRASCS